MIHIIKEKLLLVGSFDACICFQFWINSHYCKRTRNSRVLYSGCWCISCIAEFDKMDVRFLTNTHLLQETPNSCMHLMCTAIHSSNCLSCCTVVLHFFLSPLLVAQGFVPLSLSNVILMVAVSCYHYPNFLGCDVLPFLEKTTVFLYPIRITIILTPIFGLNPSNMCMYSDKMIFQHLQREFEAALASQTQDTLHLGASHYAVNILDFLLQFRQQNRFSD
ncbi:hypothetical protein L1987_77898 [Smallanthus sonchifolius]|uniref:Uncharacterized protein n=1 Tax=Smallanthus sonchifolius TaxID=185202 RepID=A0ACB8ZC73_9ASTR|nr:hypothetical protein L1987_77898 [Smallanthus sonchifolius]